MHKLSVSVFYTRTIERPTIMIITDCVYFSTIVINMHGRYFDGNDTIGPIDSY